MKKMIQRLLVFFIGLPLIILLVCFLPYCHHLAFNIAVIAFSALGGLELAAMFEKKQLPVPKAAALVLGGILPASETAAVSFGLNGGITAAFCAAAVFLILASGAFSRTAALTGFVNRMAGGLAVLIYPGLFMAWIVKMSGLEQAGVVISVFLLTVLGNDSLAWAAGILFGRGNQGIIPASPNKSIAGFAGGTIASILVGTAGALLFPGAFIPRFGTIFIVSSPAGAGLILGLLSGIAAALGDLSESAIKRSCGIKDSGHLILGRGGILDSVDSIALAAPVFCLAYTLLFMQN